MDRNSIPLARAEAIRHGFDAGNFANAYTSTDLEDAFEASDLDHYPESDEEHPEHSRFMAAFSIGFFSSYEDHEIPMDAMECVEDARAHIGAEILALGYVDPWAATEESEGSE